MPGLCDLKESILLVIGIAADGQRCDSQMGWENGHLNTLLCLLQCVWDA